MLLATKIGASAIIIGIVIMIICCWIGAVISESNPNKKPLSLAIAGLSGFFATIAGTVAVFLSWIWG